MIRKALHTTGHAALSGAFSVDAARRMEACVWGALEKRPGVLRDDPRSWPVRFPDTQATGLQHLKSEDTFDPIGGPETTRALDEVLGAGGWTRPKQWGQFLVNFPERDRTGPVVGGVWHTDFPYDRGPLPGVVLFSFLADVSSGGGGTLVVEGSHRLLARYVDGLSPAERTGFKAVRTAFLRRYEWLARLVTASDQGMGREAFVRDYLHRSVDVDGVSLRVNELTGAAGDIVLSHPWQLHAPARNFGSTPRMMRIQRVQARLAPEASTS